MQRRKIDFEIVSFSTSEIFFAKEVINVSRIRQKKIDQLSGI